MSYFPTVPTIITDELATFTGPMSRSLAMFAIWLDRDPT
jgi:hypothetical protein